MWRLVCNDLMTYTEMKELSLSEVLEANAALDYFIELQEKELNKK